MQVLLHFRLIISETCPVILVLADDMTGALEAGAKFADRGLRARVTIKREVPAGAEDDVLVIDTETRHLSEDAAHRVVLEICDSARAGTPDLIYKKTDSTLRGNIAAEFQALRTVFPDRRFVFAPAYEEMGRTVRDGNLYVWDTLLHESEFARDPLNPVRQSNIAALIRDEGIVIGSIDESYRIVAGPACVVDSLAGGVAQRRTMPTVRKCLVVNGSRHPASIEQLEFATQERCFTGPWACFAPEIQGSGLERAAHLGERVRQKLTAEHFDGLIAFGGDTAFGIHSALGSPDFEPWGEVLPGVPVSRCGGLYWITKAGGFGHPDLLYRLHELLG